MNGVTCSRSTGSAASRSAVSSAPAVRTSASSPIRIGPHQRVRSVIGARPPEVHDQLIDDLGVDEWTVGGQPSRRCLPDCPQRKSEAGQHVMFGSPHACDPGGLCDGLDPIIVRLVGRGDDQLVHLQTLEPVEHKPQQRPSTQVGENLSWKSRANRSGLGRQPERSQGLAACPCRSVADQIRQADRAEARGAVDRGTSAILDPVNEDGGLALVRLPDRCVGRF